MNHHVLGLKPPLNCVRYCVRIYVHIYHYEIKTSLLCSYFLYSDGRPVSSNGYQVKEYLIHYKCPLKTY